MDQSAFSGEKLKEIFRFCEGWAKGQIVIPKEVRTLISNPGIH